MNPINLHELKDVMARVFVNTPLPSDIAALKYGDFDEWDSLGNFSLLLSIENQFGIRFTMDQLSSMQSVSEILKILNSEH